MNNSVKEILKGSFLGVVGKILAGLVNFISLPILLVIYGKEEFGLVGVAMSTNAFLQIINMGVPTGAVKHFAEWIEGEDVASLKNGMQSNLLFFVAVALINSSILIYLGLNTDDYFKVSEPDTLSNLLYILAFTSFVNWYFITFQHLLLAYEKIGWVSSVNSIGSILNFLPLIGAYFLDFSIEWYFVVYTVSSLIVVPLNIYAVIKFKIFRWGYFIPKLRIVEFRKILSYSMGLFGVVILQYVANQSQPIILSMMAHRGDVEVANYRILQSITMLVSMMGGIFLQNFMPYVSKINYRGDSTQIVNFVFSTTRWLSIFISFMCFLVAFNSVSILGAYVGANGSGLSLWLSIWVIALLSLNNQGISSMMLSSGKFKPIIIGLSFASTIAVILSLSLVSTFGVGISAISYLAYKIVESCFIYGYYLPKIAKISSVDLFNRSIKIPFLIAFGSVILPNLLLRLVRVESFLVELALNTSISVFLYAMGLWFWEFSNKEKENIHGAFSFMINKIQRRT